MTRRREYSITYDRIKKKNKYLLKGIHCIVNQEQKLDQIIHERIT